MKIGAAQYLSIRGDISSNLAKHREFIEAAAAQDADLLFFPELSLTGYEPQLAQSLAMDVSDSRLDGFQQYSDSHNMVIGVGLPMSLDSQVQIGMVWFAPKSTRRRYAKQQLHADELPFFIAGDGQLVLEQSAHRLVPAICYESLQPNHANQSASLGADVYMASVAKPAGGLAKAMRHYPAIARQHQMTVIMANAVGPCDDFVSVGQSAAWSDRGDLLVQMDSDSEGIVMIDTTSRTASLWDLQTV